MILILEMMYTKLAMIAYIAFRLSLACLKNLRSADSKPSSVAPILASIPASEIWLGINKILQRSENKDHHVI